MKVRQLELYFIRSSKQIISSREIEIEENLVRLLDLTADFGVKTNAKLTPIFKLREKSKTGIQSCLYALTMTFCVNFLTYILWYKISLG